MIERHRYRGHHIVIELFEVMPRQFRWKWTIDGTHTAKSRNVLAPEAVARSEAFLYAQVMVARLRAPGAMTAAGTSSMTAPMAAPMTACATA